MLVINVVRRSCWAELLIACERARRLKDFALAVIINLPWLSQLTFNTVMEVLENCRGDQQSAASNGARVADPAALEGPR
jgi:hypothetical protein